MWLDTRRGSLLLIVVLSACGGASLSGRVFDNGRVRYHVGELPEGWRELDAEGDVAFFHRERAAVISVHARCDRDEDDVPLQSLTQHLMIGFTEREVESQEVMPFDGREAMRTVVRARLDGVPRAMTLYVMKKNGCVYDLLYAAPPDRYAEGASEFESFVRGFGTEER
ncbi:MAG: hypothetical protein IT379_36675 [Deltaproteobacteria bacterium]|nr:hypothetical protein [Deltaproteobacteria bacterium]